MDPLLLLWYAFAAAVNIAYVAALVAVHMMLRLHVRWDSC